MSNNHKSKEYCQIQIRAGLAKLTVGQWVTFRDLIGEDPTVGHRTMMAVEEALGRIVKHGNKRGTVYALPGSPLPESGDSAPALGLRTLLARAAALLAVPTGDSMGGEWSTERDAVCAAIAALPARKPREPKATVAQDAPVLPAPAETGEEPIMRDGRAMIKRWARFENAAIADHLDAFNAHKSRGKLADALVGMDLGCDEPALAAPGRTHTRVTWHVPAPDAPKAETAPKAAPVRRKRGAEDGAAA